MTKHKLIDLAQATGFKPMTVADCIFWLEWTTEKDFDKDGETGKITCSCGETVKTGGWTGTEHAWCPKCHKGMQDLAGFLPTENAGFYYSADKVNLETELRWVPLNIWRF